VPIGGSTIDLPQVVRWLHDFLAANKLRLSAGESDDPMLSGANSPALERYRLARAKREEFGLERDLGDFAAALDGTGALDEVARLFRDQHTEHLAAVSAATRSVGGTPYEEPNPFLFDNVVSPAAESIAALEPADQPLATLNLAYTLEDVAAQTYTSAGGLFSAAELREAGMSIGAVEARHVSVLLGALQEPAAPFPFARTVNAVDEAAFITPDGPVTTP
jgi:hypothetical protein